VEDKFNLGKVIFSI